ncbi:mitochondrial protein Pet127-domain-containing protein [Kockovaella imperatae]|uniref:Mitochondrial protein Pet127-domain-containing protein n=1 Tax=Kockovaella imperatae TaxID=4999 RepID=A0A1Y1UG91_9TREE|nr:mitochondrial protein Pet127-domain-containing protein [Kockovaella imperatae]ORX36075.1 mitochondrial protein Pet127-domain-containing protein [Kockovaella imperatae]
MLTQDETRRAIFFALQLLSRSKAQRQLHSIATSTSSTSTRRDANRSGYSRAASNLLSAAHKRPSSPQISKPEKLEVKVKVASKSGSASGHKSGHTVGQITKAANTAHLKSQTRGQQTSASSSSSLSTQRLKPASSSSWSKKKQLEAGRSRGVSVKGENGAVESLDHHSTRNTSAKANRPTGGTAGVPSARHSLDHEEQEALAALAAAENWRVPIKRNVMEEILSEASPRAGDGGVSDDSGNVRSAMTARGRIAADQVSLRSQKPDRHMVVNRLRSNLTGIPFSPGIHFMQDPRTGVYNFDPNQLHQVPSPEEFAYDRVAPYSKPSTHKELANLAEKASCTYAGSTSTLTKAFSQIYFLISRDRGVNIKQFSGHFTTERTDFSFGCQLPACLEVTKNPENGVWYVDNDKSVDVDNILADYGVIMEKMLTLEPEEFAKLLKKNPGEPNAQQQDVSTEAFYYQHGAKLMMRSQLDCYDPRLPGTGVFDIKTRACLPIRYDRANWIANSAYEISQEKGFVRSFEREDYDMLRATMLKYSMQARIGAMDGIFVAYHSTAKIFGFRYLPLAEIDSQLFGTTEMAEMSFKLCVALFESLLDEVVGCFPGHDKLSVTIKHFPGTMEKSAGTLAAFVQPRGLEEDGADVPIRAVLLSVDNFIDGEKVEGGFELNFDENSRKDQTWAVDWQIAVSGTDAATQQKMSQKLNEALREINAMQKLAPPEGVTLDQMRALDRVKYGADETVAKKGRAVWITPNLNQLMYRKEAKDSASEHKKRMKEWREGHDKVLSWQPVPTPTP